MKNDKILWTFALSVRTQWPIVSKIYVHRRKIAVLKTIGSGFHLNDNCLGKYFPGLFNRGTHRLLQWIKYKQLYT